MGLIDWIVLGGTLAFIVIYGAWKTRKNDNLEEYLLGNNEAKWWTVGLSVMATQASAITFLSTPGQAYTDGMGFVQFYFGLPLAMVFICIFLIPLYKNSKVFTAYEFLEKRFDLKTRSLAAVLFLMQRGLGAGITIFAPAIILSTVLNWDLKLTILIIGVLVIIYTVTGGTKAVYVTHKQQMGVIFVGLIATFFVLMDLLPDENSLIENLEIAAIGNKLNVLDFSFDPGNRYTVWTGILGGFFLALAYFGTDQSQVQRYISAESIKESRLGLIMNGLLKVPMQFFILFLGVLVFTFYQFNEAPIFFNENVTEEILAGDNGYELTEANTNYAYNFRKKNEAIQEYIAVRRDGTSREKRLIKNRIIEFNEREAVLRTKAKEIIKAAKPEAELNDKDFVFINFILNYLPKGLVGLLLAVIISAAMSSTASELNALGSTSTIDIYKRSIAKDKDDAHYVKASKLMTVFWGVFAIFFASICSLFENLIQFVNIIGSIFYGTILGIFMTAIFLKSVRSHAVFIAAIITQCMIVYLYKLDLFGFLWLNPIGCFSVMALALVLSPLFAKSK